MRKKSTRCRELALAIFQTALPQCTCLTIHMGHSLLAEVVVLDKHFRLGIENRPHEDLCTEKNRMPYSSLRERSSFLMSRLMRAASSDEVSNNCVHRLLSPSSFACPSRYDTCMIASSELLKS